MMLRSVPTSPRNTPRRTRWAHGSRAWCAPSVAALSAPLLAVSPGLADEPRLFTEPSVLREPTELTQVVDAFDDDDPFDVHLSLGFQSSHRFARIRRESSLSQPSSGAGYVLPNLTVGRYEETTTRLTTRADIGLYRDLALVVRLPIVLANERAIGSSDGSAGRASTILAGLPGEQLFRLPFEAPTRSGLEYLALGLDAALMNQMRDPVKPTWVIGVEGRFDLGEPMRACSASTEPLNVDGATPRRCAHPADVDRDGVPAESPLEGSFSGNRSPGVSRGVTGLEVHTYVSRRIKHLEPYFGARALFEFPNGNSDYALADWEGSPVTGPPMRATLLAGLTLIPWEVRERFQRVSFDVRITGTYVSKGRDYSELYDALGSSDAPSLRHPSFTRYRANPDPQSGAPAVLDPDAPRAYFTGLTTVEQHGALGMHTAFTWQAGEYVKFHLGGGLTVVRGHLVTFDEPCDLDAEATPGTAGPCRSANGTPKGRPNPNYRRVIDDPGHRFRVDDALELDFWLNATVMF